MTMQNNRTCHIVPYLPIREGKLYAAPLLCLDRPGLYCAYNVMGLNPTPYSKDAIQSCIVSVSLVYLICTNCKDAAVYCLCICVVT